MSDNLGSGFSSIDSNFLFGYDFNCEPCVRRDASEDAVEAVGYCTNCKEYLCRECYNAHCIPTPSENHITVLLTKEHRWSTSTDQDSGADNCLDICQDNCTEPCSDHEGKVVKYYCTTHKQLGCRSCMKTAHAQCPDILDISGASRNLDSDQVQEFSDKVDTIKKSTNQMLKTAKHHIEKTETNYEKVLRDIEHFRQDIIDQVDKLTDEMKQKAEENRNENIDRLQAISDKYKEATENLQEINDQIESLQHDNKTCSLLVYMKNAEEKVQSIQEYLSEINTDNRTTLYKFKPNKDMLKKEESLGSLHKLDKLGHHWVNNLNPTDQLGAIFIRSGKHRYHRVSKRPSRHSVKRLAQAFDKGNLLDVIKESNEMSDI